MAAAHGALDIVDKRICKAPEAYDGTKTRWRHYKMALGGYVAALSSELKNMMKIAETLSLPVVPTTLGFSPRQQELNGNLFVILTATLKQGSKAMDTLCNVDEGNGLEVFRRLARKAVVRTAGHDRGRLLYVTSCSRRRTRSS